MPEVQVSAPGKLVLVGEYAVLEGAPAISAAVDRRARVTVKSVAAAHSTMTILNSGVQHEFSLNADGQPEWHNNPGQDAALMNAVLWALRDNAQALQNAAPVAVELCTQPFYMHDSAGLARKVGVGSSAALTVALTVALQIFIGRQPDEAVCLAAHRHLQDGGGSGIDVQTSWSGGVILRQTALPGSEYPTQSLMWPPGLLLQPVWTGISAATPVMLGKLADFAGTSTEQYRRIMHSMTAVGNEAVKCWQDGDAAAVTAALDQYGQALLQLDEAAGIGIWSDEHRRFKGLAARHGLGYKPSGAGGGDFGLVYGLKASAIESFLLEQAVSAVPQLPSFGWSAEGFSVEKSGSAL